MDFQSDLSESDAILFGIKSLVETYEPFTCKPATDAFVSNEEYMNITELYFVVKKYELSVAANVAILLFVLLLVYGI